MRQHGVEAHERVIEKLACPAGKRDCLVSDDVQRGLVVRVMATGSKSYLAHYAVAGRKRRVPLGSVDAKAGVSGWGCRTTSGAPPPPACNGWEWGWK